ncbi:MAG: endonuclease/exonuclease/phosphatase family protein [Candidatus Bipolaricaulia bacterium]
MKTPAYVYANPIQEISQADFPTHSEQIDAEVLTHYEYVESRDRDQPAAGQPLNVVVFNAMRGTHLDGIIERIRETPELRDPDLLLASELDIGMVRSGNRHTPRELGDALGLNYTFGVEFVELSLGDKEEQQLPGENAIGLHGNVVFSRFPLEEIRIIRLPQLYDWFYDIEKRIGSRIAVAARLSGTSLTVVSVHLENFTSPEGRQFQTERMLEAIEGPALVGGDFNSMGYTEMPTDSKADKIRKVQERQNFDPLHPIARELLFESFVEQGFRYEEANQMRAPTSFDPQKIDWVFVRNVEVMPGSPVVIPATADDDPNRRISDHHFLALKINLPRVSLS